MKILYYSLDNLHICVGKKYLFMLMDGKPPKYGLKDINPEHMDMLDSFKPSTKDVFEIELSKTNDKLFKGLYVFDTLI